MRGGDEGGSGEDQAERDRRIGALWPSMGPSYHRAQRKGAVSFLCGVVGVLRRHLLSTPVRLNADGSGDCRQSHPERQLEYVRSVAAPRNQS